MPHGNGQVTYDRSEIEAIKTAVDLAAFIEEHGVALQKVGPSNWKGLCPFHEESKPSFAVNTARGLWNCFGCNKAGDVFSFLKLKEGMDFAAARDYLRGRVSLPAPAPRPLLFNGSAPTEK